MDDLFDAQVQVVAEKKALEMLSDVTSLSELLRKSLDAQAAAAAALRKTQSQLVATQEEKAAVEADIDRLMNSEGTYDMRHAAKLIKYKRADGKQVGRTELFAFLRDVQFLNHDSSPSQSAIDNGWLDQFTGTYVQKGVERPYVKTVVTPKGTQKIRRLMETAFDAWWSGE